MSFGGWIPDRPAATGASSNVTKAVGWVATTMAMLAVVGTGGEIPLVQLHRPVSRNQIIVPPVVEVEHSRTPNEDLARIRSVLSPAVSDLATTLGVTRQSIYNWINGEPVIAENAVKLRDLSQAADVLAHEGIVVNSSLLKRKFADGKNLFQVAQAGDSAREAALMLVQILKQESVQRARMSIRFAGRIKTPATADFDLPASSDIT
jgi:transcriptional regulator with XRE-family HTH domain